MLVTGDTVAWVGSEHAAEALADSSMDVADLQGALITPGFVDSHVHTTETGLALTSLDLNGVNSMGELLDMVARAAKEDAGTIMGNGWDESRWPERRAPTADELENASGGGRDVYLVRADVHSAVVSASLGQRLDLHTLDGWDEGFVVREAHLAARTAVRTLEAGAREHLQRTALTHAASQGIVAVVEMAAPHIAPREDLLSLTALSGPLPEVLAYWGQAASSEEEMRSLLAGFEGRVLGLGGDLNVDGSIGSHTARMRVPYADKPSCGTAFMHADDVAAHLGAATALGTQAGFHVIGDAGLDTVIAGLEKAATSHGIDRVRAARHRLEHVELADDAAISALAGFGITVSAQPGFDALWGAPGGLYEQRLGESRYRPMNRVGSLLSQGVPVCLGSDSPVTRMSPWQSVRACLTHASPEERISARAAFLAHTRAGWRAAGVGHPMLGQLVPGAPASFAVWEVAELMIQTPDTRVQSWSTDPRAGTPLLPALDGGEEPRCLETVHLGERLYASGDLPGR
ncbi:amidohydrolase family protein [Arthrobacter sp. JZ12]|nr:amidohydrolase family protein [Arthrobacter sp. JZ12]